MSSHLVAPAPPQSWRFVVLGLGLLGLFAYLSSLLHHVQVIRHEELSAQADRQAQRVRPILAPRGSIYDASGTPLAVSQGTWSVIADPTYMEDRLRATIELSRILGLPRETLREHFESNRNGRVIAQGLVDPEPGGQDLVAEIRALKLSGIRVERHWGRRYDKPGLASHVLGFVNDGVGAAGIELSMEKILSGTAGSDVEKVDARGRSLDELSQTPAVPGAHVQLTIDISIQRTLESRLAEAMSHHDAERGCGLVVDPRNGAILAMASYPSFDPTQRVTMVAEHLRNNTTGLVYEPGSTFKPLIAGAAVADGLARWNESIFCENGRWSFNGRTIHDHSYKHGGHQQLTLVQGIAKSDNILMAKLGHRLGPVRLSEWVERLGFGKRTGIQLPGEERGIVHPRNRWTLTGACMSVPMGHEVSVTPLQLVMAHAAVANGGLWLPPRLVQRAWRVEVDGSETPVPVADLGQPNRFFQESDAAQIQEAMTHTMEEGTGKGVQLDGYSSAGKTGTAEKLVNGRYSKSDHVGSFVCWAPAEPGVRAAVVALVVIDNPRKNGHYGGSTAGPVVRDVLQFSLQHLGIEPRPMAANHPLPAQRRGR